MPILVPIQHDSDDYGFIVSLEIGEVSYSTLFFYKIILSIQSSLCFIYSLRLACQFLPKKNPTVILIEIALHL